MTDTEPGSLSSQEIERRATATLRRMLTTPKKVPCKKDKTVDRVARKKTKTTGKTAVA